MDEPVKATMRDVREAKAAFSEHCTEHRCRPMAADPDNTCDERIRLWHRIGATAALWNEPTNQT